MKPNPQFKPLAIEYEVNNWQWYWVAIKATHISLKRGKISSWCLKSKQPLPDDYRSTNNRRFIKKQGNCLITPEFESLTSGYKYNPLIWNWRCRRCQKEVEFKSLNPQEICADCNHVQQEKHTALS